MTQQYNQNQNQNQTNDSNNINSKDFMIGTLIGGIVGAAAALLMAPKSGKDLRNDINEKTVVLKEKTGQWKDTAVEKSNELAAVAKEKSSALTKSVQEQSNNVVGKLKTYRTNNNELQETNEELQAVSAVGTTPADETEDVNQKLEETKKAFDETEKTYNQ
ncbi:YtxH domain-containing protein [Rossellomorea vietnamensis]|uniref:YtxH domain-containing protein n=1 Tax=Rossellomorea vietnamensis TaxID=218284 RepID=A0ACD4C623_9BACI|nr:YtxH domain-containing protein [Rossellomorea vietnamensis]UXH43824.1 YtxH domain-containing protein [Rossellomorea vietnamensis]WQI95179.1 YtxH domain-containing protein [Rossellomorea vietnamensis]